MRYGNISSVLKIYFKWLDSVEMSSDIYARERRGIEKRALGSNL